MYSGGKKKKHFALVYPIIDDLIDKVDNNYVLATLVLKRVEQLDKKYRSEGISKQTKDLIAEALEEVKEGKIHPKLSDEI